MSLELLENAISIELKMSAHFHLVQGFLEPNLHINKGITVHSSPAKAKNTNIDQQPP